VRGLSRVLIGRRLVLAIAAVVAAVAGAGGTALALTPSVPSHAVSMSRGDLTRAALKVTAGTPFLDVSMGRLGGTLLRVSTPDGAPVRPVLSGSRLIVLSLAGASVPPGHVQDSRYVVRVVLNSAVTWALDLAGGTQRTVADLRGGTVTGVGDGGLGRARRAPAPPVGDAALPAGRRGEPVPAEPARRRSGPGDGRRRRVSVSVDDRELTGIAGGTVLTPPGWATATSRIDLNATSGFSQLTVSRWSSPGS
jgi:hypothetical protein